MKGKIKEVDKYLDNVIKFEKEALKVSNLFEEAKLKALIARNKMKSNSESAKLIAKETISKDLQDSNNPKERESNNFDNLSLETDFIMNGNNLNGRYSIKEGGLNDIDDEDKFYPETIDSVDQLIVNSRDKNSSFALNFAENQNKF